MKRLLDILLSSVALAALLPLLVPVAIVLRCTGEGYIFYRQQRVGKGGRSFGLYKFVTMAAGSEKMPGGLLTKKDDPRVLPFGRILRATKINEIPQLLNVLRGDMSLIGPRPQAREHFEVFPEHVKREIVKVRPGLSGIGSIVFRDEEAILARCAADQQHFYAHEIAPYKGELELWYVQHQSVPLDLLLILLTIQAVLFPKRFNPLKAFRDLPRPHSTALSACLIPV